MWQSFNGVLPKLQLFLPKAQEGMQHDNDNICNHAEFYQLSCILWYLKPCPWEFYLHSKTKLEHDLSKNTLPRLRGQLGTLNNENVDVPDVKNGNRKLIFYLFQCWLDKFVLQRELKQRHSDSLCETKLFHQARHRTSGCYSWRPEGQRSRCLSSLMSDVKIEN